MHLLPPSSIRQATCVEGCVYRGVITYSAEIQRERDRLHTYLMIRIFLGHILSSLGMVSMFDTDCRTLSP